MIDVRPAAGEDAEALAALRWEFRAGRRPPTEDREAFLSRCAAWMRRELSAPGPWRAWVAVGDRDICGQVWLQLFDKLPNPVDEEERLAYLSNLYVEPSARGGVGVRLLESALAFAAASGVDRVVLWPSPRSVPLYERHGFTRTGEVMELKLRT